LREGYQVSPPCSDRIELEIGAESSEIQKSYLIMAEEGPKICTRKQGKQIVFSNQREKVKNNARLVYHPGGKTASDPSHISGTFDDSSQGFVLLEGCWTFISETLHRRRQKVFEVVFASHSDDCRNERKGKFLLVEKVFAATFSATDAKSNGSYERIV
jgi:hypothetical protein